MKKVTLLFYGLLFTFGVNGQQSQLTESKIRDVVVFLNKAQITRTATTSIAKGNTELIINGLSSQIDPNSIQVNGRGTLTILGIRHERNYMSNQQESKEVKILRDSLKYYTTKITDEKNLKSIYKKEEKLLTNNQVISGKDRGVTVPELKAMADFYTNRMLLLSKKSKMADNKIAIYKVRKQAVQNQLNELNAFYKKNTSSIVVEVSATKATKTFLKLDYVVYNASWQPLYDIRSAGADKPIDLHYKANVIQNTGVSWENVRLTLSTANPNLSNTKPQLIPWYINIQKETKPEIVASRSAKMSSGSATEIESEDFDDDDLFMYEEITTTSDYTQTVNTSLNTSFKINLPYSVASGGKATTVDIRKESLKAEYTYAVVPRIDKDAFLIASVSDWDQYDLLPGNANLFYEGTYVGKTYINPEQTKDKLELSLGRDKHIVVERKPIKDYTSKRFIGTNRKETYAYKISARNTSQSTVQLRIEDQVPVSSNSEISVEAIDISGGDFDKVTGKVTWELSIPKGSTQSKQLSYEVKYPKNKIVVGL